MIVCLAEVRAAYNPRAERIARAEALARRAEALAAALDDCEARRLAGAACLTTLRRALADEARGAVLPFRRKVKKRFADSSGDGFAAPPILRARLESAARTLESAIDAFEARRRRPLLAAQRHSDLRARIP